MKKMVSPSALKVAKAPEAPMAPAEIKPGKCNSLDIDTQAISDVAKGILPEAVITPSGMKITKGTNPISVNVTKAPADPNLMQPTVIKMSAVPRIEEATKGSIDADAVPDDDSEPKADDNGGA